MDTYSAFARQSNLGQRRIEPWAQAVLNDVRQKGGLVGKNMANLFELRFGHALHEAGIGVEYEVPGEGASTLDFGFTSKGQSWKVEMMRLQETKAAKAATKTGGAKKLTKEKMRRPTQTS